MASQVPSGVVAQSARTAVVGLLLLLPASRLLPAEFLLWPLPFLAVLAARRSARGPWLALGVLLLSQVVDPYLNLVLSLPSAPAFDVAAIAVVVRNAALVLLSVWAVRAVVPRRESGARGIPAVAGGQ